jgi:hypothetical protein
MEKKGFKFIKVTPRKEYKGGYYGGFSGIRFTFYKHLTNC